MISLVLSNRHFPRSYRDKIKILNVYLIQNKKIIYEIPGTLFCDLFRANSLTSVACSMLPSDGEFQYKNNQSFYLRKLVD